MTDHAYKHRRALIDGTICTSEYCAESNSTFVIVRTDRKPSWLVRVWRKVVSLLTEVSPC